MRGKIGRRLARVLECEKYPLKAQKAAVAITFDDVPMSACVAGRQIVEQAGGRATYYASGCFEQVEGGGFHTADVLQELHAAGHEIGCHGFGHLNYQSISGEAVSRDIEENQAYFRDIGLPKARSFAYPYGCVSPSLKARCRTFYPLCRGITSGLNSKTVDARLIKAVPLYSATWSPAQTRVLLETAKREGGLAVFFTHGVTDRPGQFDCSPQLLRETVTCAQELGLDILPLSDAFAELTQSKQAA